MREIINKNQRKIGILKPKKAVSNGILLTALKFYLDLFSKSIDKLKKKEYTVLYKPFNRGINAPTQKKSSPNDFFCIIGYRSQHLKRT